MFLSVKPCAASLRWFSMLSCESSCISYPSPHSSLYITCRQMSSSTQLPEAHHCPKLQVYWKTSATKTYTKSLPSRRDCNVICAHASARLRPTRGHPQKNTPILSRCNPSFFTSVWNWRRIPCRFGRWNRLRISRPVRAETRFEGVR